MESVINHPIIQYLVTDTAILGSNVTLHRNLAVSIRGWNFYWICQKSLLVMCDDTDLILMISDKGIYLEYDNRWYTENFPLIIGTNGHHLRFVSGSIYFLFDSEMYSYIKYNMTKSILGYNNFLFTGISVESTKYKLMINNGYQGVLVDNNKSIRFNYSSPGIIDINIEGNHTIIPI